MPDYPSRTHRRRSASQKIQTEKARIRALARKSGDTDVPGSDSIVTHETHPRLNRTVITSVQSNKDKRVLKQLKVGLKNALQREKRAKMKARYLQESADTERTRLLDALRCQKVAEGELDDARALADVHSRDVENHWEYVNRLEDQVAQYSEELTDTRNQLETQHSAVSSLTNRRTELHRAWDALRKKVERLKSQKAKVEDAVNTLKPVVTSYHLKDKHGAIQPEARDMLRKLTCEGVSTEHVSDVIGIVADALGIHIDGSVSARSVARVMLEGLVQARMQIGHEVSHADYVSICGDGTTIKNIQHESKSLYVHPSQPSSSSGLSAGTKSDAKPTFRTLGVEKATSHTSEQQLNGWLAAMDSFCSAWTRSPLGQGHFLTSRMVAPKLRGILTDHAADQKRFFQLIEAWKKVCDREIRAIPKLQLVSPEEQLHMLSDYLTNATNSISDWRTLPGEQQAALIHDAWLALAFKIGEAEFQQLDPTSQKEVDFLAWAGCCMHKELNAVKGGVGEMTKAWESLGLTPPITLRNKFEATKPTQEQSKSHYMRGAVKLGALAGALFNNKDDKKGYQSTVDHFFEKTFGYSKRFPDTSNTRYGSYCDAATELILNLDAYMHLMANLRDAKTTPGFTNIELNVFQALQDESTLTELAVLALYAQAVGHPYIRYVRNGSHNALDLGIFHAKVKEYCQAIAERPELLISQDTALSIGALDGQPWERPEVIYKILSLRSNLPNLTRIIAAFFKGALQTWERFTLEFDQDGTIANATSEQRLSAWLPPTNDVSEGLLGLSRQMIRRAPTITDNQRNARIMWPRNETYEWAKQTLSHSDEQFVRHEARIIDSSGDNKRFREHLDATLEERAEASRARQAKTAERKSNTKRKLDAVELLEGASYEDLIQLKVKDLDNQIDKLRESGDSQVRAKTTIGNKQAKIKEILAGLERRKEGRVRRSSIKKVDDFASFESADEAVETCLEDTELCYDDEVIF